MNIKSEHADDPVGRPPKKELAKHENLIYHNFLQLSSKTAACERFPPGCPVLICEYHDNETQPTLKLEEGALVARVLKGEVIQVGINYDKECVENRRTLYSVRVKEQAVDAYQSKAEEILFYEESLVLACGTPVWFTDSKSGETLAGTVIGSEHLPLPLEVSSKDKDLFKRRTSTIYSVQVVRSKQNKVFHGVRARRLAYRGTQVSLPKSQPKEELWIPTSTRPLLGRTTATTSTGISKEEGYNNALMLDSHKKEETQIKPKCELDPSYTAEAMPVLWKRNAQTNPRRQEMKQEKRFSATACSPPNAANSLSQLTSKQGMGEKTKMSSMMQSIPKRAKGEYENIPKQAKREMQNIPKKAKSETRMGSKSVALKNTKREQPKLPQECNPLVPDYALRANRKFVQGREKNPNPSITPTSTKKESVQKTSTQNDMSQQLSRKSGKKRHSPKKEICPSQPKAEDFATANEAAALTTSALSRRPSDVKKRTREHRAAHFEEASISVKPKKKTKQDNHQAIPPSENNARPLTERETTRSTLHFELPVEFGTDFLRTTISNSAREIGKRYDCAFASEGKAMQKPVPGGAIFAVKVEGHQSRVLDCYYAMELVLLRALPSYLHRFLKCELRRMNVDHLQHTPKLAGGIVFSKDPRTNTQKYMALIRKPFHQTSEEFKENALQFGNHLNCLRKPCDHETVDIDPSFPDVPPHIVLHSSIDSDRISESLERWKTGYC